MVGHTAGAGEWLEYVGKKPLWLGARACSALPTTEYSLLDLWLSLLIASHLEDLVLFTSRFLWFVFSLSLICVQFIFMCSVRYGANFRPPYF